MFAQTLNELTFRLTLAPQGPLLVKAGDEFTPAGEVQDALRLLPEKQMAYFQGRKEREQERRDGLKKQAKDRRERERRDRQAARQRGQTQPIVEEPEAADMRFVLTQRRGQKEPYLPGSSLKGVLRSHAERLACSMTPAGDGACNLFGRPGGGDEPCWQCLEESDGPRREHVSATRAYRVLCPVCKLFGCPFLAGRIRISDAYLVEPAGRGPLSRRDSVGIDRRRGAAADGAKYDFEYWDGGAFQAQVTVRNFELWQLGLLAHLLHGLDKGEIPVGFGTHRGLGRVQGAVSGLQMAYFGSLALEQRSPPLPLLGLGQLSLKRPVLAAYGFWDGEPLPSPLARGVRLVMDGSVPWRQAWAVDEPERLWEAVGPLWNPRLVDELAQARRAAEEEEHG
ncbi:MAG: RAMP superfamily CRISPR-associated protein [Anaerolineae bacterium]|nr:RAMP superfamily CRISPR-associated protein [Anaerolineae bacterium]